MTGRRMLLPLTPLYRLALALRELRLGSGFEKVRRLRFPVISIGSLSAGGSGKTPLTIALVQALTQGGLSVDVLSRGYGRQSQAVVRVDPHGAAEEFGDEPLLIAREAGVPVYVAARRYEAGAVAEQSSPSIHGLHLLDDGFQHRRLHRDVDILLLDRNDWSMERLLPAGNLREPVKAIHRATVIAIPSGDAELEAELKASGWRGCLWKLKRRMEVPAIDGPVVAFCGIARPEQFFEGLQTAGLHLASRVAFADHHQYKAHDLDCILEAARSTSATAFVTTEKDRVRLGKLAFAFTDARPLKTAGLRIEIEDESAAVDFLVQRIKAL